MAAYIVIHKGFTPKKTKSHKVRNVVPFTPNVNSEIIKEGRPLPVLSPSVVTLSPTPHASRPFHRSLASLFTLLIVMVLGAGSYTAVHRWTTQLPQTTARFQATHGSTGLNAVAPSDQFDRQLDAITHQPATLLVGDKQVPIPATTIKSWLKTSHNDLTAEDTIHVVSSAIATSVLDLAQKQVQAPVDQISVTHNGVDTVIAAGKNGSRLSDPEGLKKQAAQLAKTVLSAKGFQLSAPTTTSAFQVVGPAAFSKLIEVNVATKQMYLYESGSLVRSYPVSAGAPATPTPAGRYKIFSKFASQDMRGYNTNGTRYFQPHVHWVNYFLAGGYAIHGVYWHGSSWFGNINSSHGCVGLPDDQAKWVYDWAPIGTTVITHY